MYWTAQGHSLDEIKIHTPSTENLHTQEHTPTIPEVKHEEVINNTEHIKDLSNYLRQ